MKKNTKSLSQQKNNVSFAFSANSHSHNEYYNTLSNKSGHKSAKKSSNDFDNAYSKECSSKSCEQCDTCPQFDLCQKRVFIVGGVERMEPLYRSFVEDNGGLLDYHSGSMQGGIKKLEKCLQRADVIICPINCNSHGACVKVKNLAKKFGKIFHMLPTGSLSAVKRLLQESYS